MAKKNPQTDPSDEPGFEDALKRLEEIVRLLEEGEIGLNEALAGYEEGVQLLRRSHDLLERAERRIELLSGVDAQGNAASKPFDEGRTESSGEKSGKGGTRRSKTPTKPTHSGGKPPSP